MFCCGQCLSTTQRADGAGGAGNNAPQVPVVSVVGEDGAPTNPGRPQTAPPTATLPMLQDWDRLDASEKEVVQEKLESIVNAFAKELIRGKVFMKLGRNE